MQVDALGPEPTFRSGRIDSVSITPDDRRVLFRSASPRFEPADLFFAEFAPDVQTPIRINQPVPDDMGVGEHTLSGDGAAVIYTVPDGPPGLNRIFSYHFATGATRRLDHTDHDAPGKSDGLLVSPGGAWIVFHTADFPSATLRHFAAPPTGDTPATLLPHAPLPSREREAVFTADDEHVVLMENLTPARLWRLRLSDGQLTQLDTAPEDDWLYQSGEVDEASGLLVVKLTRNEPTGFFTRCRVIDPTLAEPARWLGDAFRMIETDALLRQPARWLVVGQENDDSPMIVRIHSLTDDTILTHEFAATSGLDFGFKVMGPNGSRPRPGLDHARGLLFYSAGADRRVLRLDDGTDASLATLIEAAGLPDATAADLSPVIIDETGRAHLFAVTEDETWRLDPAPDADTPAARVAPFVATAVAVHAQAGHVLLHTPAIPDDDSVRILHLASLDGAEPHELGPQAVVWFDPAPAYFSIAGDRLFFTQPEIGLVTADLDAASPTLARVSPEWAFVSSAAFLSVSPTREHVVVEVDDNSIHLAPLAGGAWRKISDEALAFSGIHWTPDGRWLFLNQPTAEAWLAIDTRDEHPRRLLASSFYDRIVALGHDQTIHARIGDTLSLYATDLANGATRKLGEISAPESIFTSYPQSAYTAPASDVMTLVVSAGAASDVWLVPLTVGGGEPVRLVGSTEIGSGIGVLGIDAERVYVTTYANAVHAVSRDGASRMRLTEAAPPSPGVIGANDVSLDLGRRLLAYASSYPDGVRRLHRRSLDEPAETGFAGEIFHIEGGRPLLRGGAILAADGADLWYVPPRGDGAPKRLTSPDEAGFIDKFDLSTDGRIAFATLFRAGEHVLHRFDTTSGKTAILSPPHISPGQLIAGLDDREACFVGTPAGTSTQRVFRARLLPAVVSPDGLDHPDYAAWVLASHLPIGLEAAEEDADGDGVPNLLEYILGGDALDAGDAPRLATGLGLAPDGSFEFTLPPPARLARAHLDYSPDLHAWFAAPNTEPRTIGPTSSAHELRWQVSRPPGARIFYRVRLELP